MTAANPVVPDNAVEKAAREIWHAFRPAVEWPEKSEGVRLLFEVAAEAALTAALPDLIAANTDDEGGDQ